MIDLHLHTTASDGRLSPTDLIERAVRTGLDVLAVTDHDTVAGHAEAAAAAARRGATLVRGIEVTAVDAGRDVHVLGYFVDDADETFAAFLADQRADRRRRAMEIMQRLEEAGAPVDRDQVLAVPGHLRHAPDAFAVGRPALARALVAAGHARSVADAFDRFLADGQPAFVPRRGPSPEAVVQHLLRIGAVPAAAHPAKLVDAAIVPRLIAAGMPALEVFHPDHDAEATARFGRIAAEADLVPTGGSDFHGPDTDRAWAFGRIGTPVDSFARLTALRRISS